MLSLGSYMYVWSYLILHSCAYEKYYMDTYREQVFLAEALFFIVLVYHE